MEIANNNAIYKEDGFECTSIEPETINLNEDELEDFISFIENKKDYLESGLGAFHTDDHSNW